MVGTAAGFFLLALGAGTAAGGAGEAAGPPGPAFGNNAYRSEIRDDGARDADDFAGPLAAGETLSVEVRVPWDGGLEPEIALFDPSGAERTPPVKAARGGRAVSFRRFAADRTGTWIVRVRGREDSEGAYEVRFRVGPPAGPRTGRSLLGGGAPRVAVLPFEALRGSRLDLRIAGVPPGALPPFLEVVDPSGRTLPGPSSLIERRGTSLVLRGLPLDGPHGTWRILAGTDGGPGTRSLSLSWRVAPPRRPAGVSDLDPEEPALAPRSAPHEATVGSLLRLEGRGFSEAPLPAVLLGGRPAAVLSVAPGGVALSLRLPSSAPEEPLDAVVVNPDGQSALAAGYVRVLPPGPPVLRAIEPVPIRTTPGSDVAVTVSLSGHAPPGGADIRVAVEGCDASFPSVVTIPPYGLQGTFEIRAGLVPGTGRLSAAWGRTVEVPLEILALPGTATTEVDLSNWVLLQTSSARSFVLPPGTVLPRGGAVVVARNSPKAAFEAFWGTTLGSGVVYIDSGDRFPSLNGDETLTLVGPSGAVVDGPTPKLVAGRNLQRRAGAPAGTISSWIDLQAAPADATPGNPGPGIFDGAVRITEIADPAGSGQFVHEFVEIGWDAP